MDLVSYINRFGSLPVDGLDAPRCGCLDVSPPAAAGTLEARWGKRRLTYQVESVPPAPDRATWDAAIAGAFAAWAAVLDLEFVRVDGPADIRIFAAPIDGPFNVLAQAQLPSGDNHTRGLWVQLDSRDRWGQGGVDPLAVLCHELGHTFGLTHSQKRGALMYPTYNRDVQRPQEDDDVTRAVALGYGRARPQTPPPAGALNLSIDPTTRTILVPPGWTARTTS